jgi:hypothetical protein
MTLPLCGALLVALIWVGLAIHIPGADSVGNDTLTAWFTAVLAVAAGVYFVAVRAAVAAPPRRALALVALVALAIRASTLIAPPFLSSDIYRYVWDGRVQQAGINPYRYVPADPALADLRDAGYEHINRRDYARTIYPPAAQLVFRLAAALDPTVFGMRLVMLGAEAVALLCMARLLMLAGLPSAHLLIAAWNPLAVWSFALDGHVDALAVGFLGAALLARALRRPGLAGAALAGAIGAKLLPVVVAPALWRPRGAKHLDWRFPVVCALVLAAGYAAFSGLLYPGVGWDVFGFLPTYATEEDLAQGSGFWAIAGLEYLVSLPHWASMAYLALVTTGMAALALRMMTTVPPAEQPRDILRVGRNAAILAALATATLSPHYPWYFVWLALPACLYPSPPIVWLSVAPLLLYLDPIHDRFVWPTLVYLPAIALALREVARSVKRRLA